MDSLALSAFPPFFAYCFVQGITPGPANLCSLSTTMRHGTAAALRQWLGLLIGFFVVSLIAVCITWGAQEWFDQALPALSVLGAAYVAWLAFKMLRPASEKTDGAGGRPTVFGGFLIQVTNVKVVLICLTALVAYVAPYTQQLGVLLFFGLIIPLVGLSCNMVWILAGVRLQTWYAAHRRAADIAMASALLLCALGMILPLLQNV